MFSLKELLFVGEGFPTMMGIVAPDLKVLSRNSMKSRIDKMYSEERERLISDLSNVSSLSLTTDTWTSNASKSYLTVT